MNRNVNYAKVVDGLVDAAKELNVRNVLRAADTADAADAAAAAHASTERGAGAIEKNETDQRVLAELRAKAALLGLRNSLSGLDHVEAPKDYISLGNKMAFVSDERRLLGVNRE